MTQFNGPIDILKMLDSSNCGKCHKPTCLAFAGAVFKGQSKLDDCPKLESDVIEKYGDYTSSHISADQLGNAAIDHLKNRIAQIDLASAAQRLGADYEDGKLTIKCLGKDVSITQDGSIITEIHVNLWMAGPILTYILDGKGVEVSGKWVTFRDLDGGEYKYPLFEQRCEKPLKRVADTYTGLFEDMLQIFNGKKVDYHYFADISIMLHPLPKVPIMICYSKPVDDLESTLSIFFDSTIVDNLGFDGAFSLGAGLTLMFEKIALRHSGR
ncbi:MAG: DUF3786 domain-containing protein [Chloroflexi bacterium]|jgi:hypothetical protein|nr:DUF3786 domain-containing protein [Chloroflexota bacterium]